MAIAQPVLAEELITEWITPEQGATESSLGVTIQTVEPIGDEGEQRLTLSVPKSVAQDTDNIPEVIIYGRKPDKSEPQLHIRHEWVSDYDADHYGLVLYIGKEGNIPLRLYFKGQDDY